MKQYLVVKKVMLLVGSKTYRKDAVITESDVGKDKIKRYLDRGYIRPVGTEEKQEEKKEPPFYLTAEEFLTPEQTEALERKDLVAYAKHIEIGDFANNISTTNLLNRVNKFIEESFEKQEGEKGSDGQQENGANDGEQ